MDELTIKETEYVRQELMPCNQYTQKFGLSLSEQEAKELVIQKREVLQEQRRIELGESILKKIIFVFCDSPYIYQDNYIDMIERLTEIFFLYKNESMDELSDDELLDYMKQSFDGECEGSMDFLEDTALEQFARKIRKQGKAFFRGTAKEKTACHFDLEEDEIDL